jgi:hypothetical protein
MSKTHLDHQIVLRIAEPLRAQLELEADADGRKLASLIRYVLIQHVVNRVTTCAAQ